MGELYDAIQNLIQLYHIALQNFDTGHKGGSPKARILYTVANTQKRDEKANSCVK